MRKTITLKDIESLSNQLKAEGKAIVLAGGCFDIFHYGHLHFLKTAKSHGDILMVLLESDEKVRKLKGPQRPITTQTHRAEILSEFPFIDFVVLLKPLKNDQEYMDIVQKIKPATIAVTQGDPQLAIKTKQAKTINGKVVEIDHVNTASTSEIVNLLAHDL